jgi:hypothetical protein
METPIYGVAEAAQYLRVPQNTLAYWLKGVGTAPPLIKLASTEPPRLSFSNLLECYMLAACERSTMCAFPRCARPSPH